jgi:Cu-processing system permease protein
VNHPIILIAWQEFTLNRRIRRVASFAGLFTLITLLLAYFGIVTSGYARFQDFTRTSASIINLGGFILPLFSLLLGVFSFLSNKDYIDLLVTEPVSRTQVILGKYLGLCLSLVGATLIGFGAPGVVISLVVGTEGALMYAVVVGLSLLSGVVFLGLALFISLISNRQQIALGAAVGLWIFFELLYGMAVLGSTLYLSPTALKPFLLFGLFGNPIDLTRVLSLLVIGGPHFFGPAGATLVKTTGSSLSAGIWGLAGLLIWLIIPLFGTVRIFARQNL